MANIRKFSDMRAIGHLCKHYERGVEAGNYSNDGIDETKTSANYNLAPDRGKQTDYIKQTISEVMDGRTMRKDAVKMCCCVLDAPTSLVKEGKEKELQRYFREAYRFLTYRYGRKSGLGEAVVVSAYVHMDEKTPHLHFAFMPIMKKKDSLTFCAKDVINKADLKTLHDDLGDYLESKGVCKKRDILNGKTQKDANGRALSVKEMKKRGYLKKRERTMEEDRSLEADRSPEASKGVEDRRITDDRNERTIEVGRW